MCLGSLKKTNTSGTCRPFPEKLWFFKFLLATVQAFETLIASEWFTKEEAVTAKNFFQTHNWPVQFSFAVALSASIRESNVVSANEIVSLSSLKHFRFRARSYIKFLRGILSVNSRKWKKMIGDHFDSYIKIRQELFKCVSGHIIDLPTMT